MPSRNSKLKTAKLVAVAESKQAKKEQRARDRKVKPWRALQGEWFDHIESVYGPTLGVSKWTVVEQQLCRKLVAEIGLPVSTKMAKLFIEQQHDRGEVPAFRLFWAMRDKLRARVEKKIERKQDIREFDAEAAAKRKSKFGW